MAGNEDEDVLAFIQRLEVDVRVGQGQPGDGGGVLQGRDSEIVDLMQRVATAAGTDASQRRWVAVCGAAGVGKTAVALAAAGASTASSLAALPSSALASIPAPSTTFQRTWRVDGTTATSLLLGYQRLATELQVGGGAAAKAASLADTVKAELAKAAQDERWLLIVDNIESADGEVVGLLPPPTGRTVVVLVTTLPAARLPSEWSALALSPLGTQEAVRLLAHATGPDVDNESDAAAAAAAVAERLSGLPLALVLARQHAHRKGLAWPEYLAALLAADGPGEPVTGNVAGCFDQAAKAALGESADCAYVFQLFQCLHIEAVPRALFETALRMARGPSSAPDVLGIVAAYGLIALGPSSVSTHRAQQQAMARMSPCELRVAKKVGEVLHAVVDEQYETNRLLMRLVLVHYEALLQWMTAKAPNSMELASALQACGSIFAYSFAQPFEAKGLFEASLAIKERLLGPDDVSVASTLGNLGNTHGDLGDHATKRALLERALAINERVYGADHPEVAITLTNLGNALGSLGDFAGQRAMLERALIIKEANNPKDHVRIASTVYNLSLAHRSLLEYATARAYGERAARIYAKAYGADHPNTKAANANLASLPAH